MKYRQLRLSLMSLMHERLLRQRTSTPFYIAATEPFMTQRRDAVADFHARPHTASDMVLSSGEYAKFRLCADMQ